MIWPILSAHDTCLAFKAKDESSWPSSNARALTGAPRLGLDAFRGAAPNVSACKPCLFFNFSKHHFKEFFMRMHPLAASFFDLTLK
jgi:hypothetical protein